MRLYELPRSKEGLLLYIERTTPKIEIIFHKIDGMYSYCKNIEGEIIHINASTKIQISNRSEDLVAKSDRELKIMLTEKENTPYQLAQIATEIYLRK